MSPQEPASPYRIRLPAPWRAARVPVNATAATPSATSASVIFRRSFQRPTGLASQSAVALEVTLLEPLAIDVALNGTACSALQRSDLAFEVPLSLEQLQPTNQLEITVQFPANATPTAGAGATEQPTFGQHYLAQVALVIA